MKPKIIFVGFDNPESEDPRYALYPASAGSVGGRLLKIMQAAEPNVTKEMFVKIPKTNLLPLGSVKKHGPTIKAAGAILVAQLSGTGTRAILLGGSVRDSVMKQFCSDGVPDAATWVGISGSRYAWVPHPSGRSAEYSDEKSKRRFGQFLVDTIIGVES